MKLHNAYYDRGWTELDAALSHHALFRRQIITDLCRAWQQALSNAPVVGQPRILDLGCGFGWLSQWLTRFGTVVGVEPSTGGAERALRDFGEDSRVTFVQGTAKTLLEAGWAGIFDLVVSSEVIEHVEDQQQFVVHICRLLKPGGHVILSTPRKEVWSAFCQSCTGLQPVEEWLSERQLCNLLTDNGFDMLRHERGYIQFTRRGIYRVLESDKLNRLIPSVGLGRLWQHWRNRHALYQFALARNRGGG